MHFFGTIIFVLLCAFCFSIEQEPVASDMYKTNLREDQILQSFRLQEWRQSRIRTTKDHTNSTEVAHIASQSTRLKKWRQARNHTGPSHNYSWERGGVSSNDKLSDLETSDADPSTWAKDPGRWVRWWPPFYAEALDAMAVLNQRLPDSVAPDAPVPRPNSPTPLDFPVFVMSLPHRLDRRASTRAHLAALGFVNVSFPPITHWQSCPPAALARWRAEGIEPAAPGPAGACSSAYEANAADQLLVIRRALVDGHSRFAIFEVRLIFEEALDLHEMACVSLEQFASRASLRVVQLSQAMLPANVCK